ncbi:unknown [Firmicutes bacterium CAG:460]|nr:unknown [Firmicutes bacterium CAG:460]
MDLVTLMYKYINRFINSDELLKSLEELDLNKFTDEEKVSIKKLIDDIKSIKDKIPNEVDEIEKNRIEINEKYVNGIDKILQNNTLENKLKEKFLKIREGLLEDKKKVKDGGKLYESLFTLLADNDLINYYCDLLNDYELLEFIAQYISVPMPPQISQEKFDKIVKVGIENDEREWLWRLAFNYNRKNKDFSLIEDYFIEKRDDYYLTELISAVREDLNMKKLKKKVIATKDKKFINKVKSTLKDYEIEF